MRQLVGQDCVHCRQRIGSELVSRFCPSCGNPVHMACVAAAHRIAGRCPTCGAPAESVREAAARRQAAASADRLQTALGSVAKGFVFIFGGMLAAVACNPIAAAFGLTGRVVVGGSLVTVGVGLVVRGLLMTSRSNDQI